MPQIIRPDDSDWVDDNPTQDGDWVDDKPEMSDADIAGLEAETRASSARLQQPKQSVIPQATGSIEPVDDSWWGKATTPLTEAPTRFAQQVSEYINPERGTTGLRGIGSAYIEALGEQVSGLTSPLSLGTLGLASGETALVRQAANLAKVGKIAKARQLMTAAQVAKRPIQAVGAASMYSGLQKVADSDKPWQERIQGVPEIALGALGVRNRIPAARRAMEARPARIQPLPTDIPAEDILGQQPIKAKQTGPSTFDIDLYSSEQPRGMRQIAAESADPLADLGIRPPGPIIDPRDPQVLAPEQGPLPPAPSGEVGPPATPGAITEGTLEAEQKLKTLQTPIATKEKPPRELTPQEEEEFLRKLDEEDAAAFGKLAPPTKPTAVTIKKDIPATVNKFMEQGYEITGYTPEGYPMMSPLKLAQEPIVQPRPIEPEVLTPEVVKDEPINFDVVGTDISGAVSQEDLNKVPGPTSKRKLGMQVEDEDLDTFEGQVVPFTRGGDAQAEAQRNAAFWHEEVQKQLAAGNMSEADKATRMAEQAEEKLQTFEGQVLGPDEVNLTIPPQKQLPGKTDEEPQFSRQKFTSQGEPIKDWTEEELADRKRKIAYDWGVARAKARELDIDTTGMGRLQQLHDAIREIESDWEPQFKPVAGMGPEKQADKPIKVRFVNQYEDYGKEPLTVQEAETRLGQIEDDLQDAYRRNNPKQVAHYEFLRDRAEKDYIELLGMQAGYTGEEPLMARTPEGKLTIGQNVRRSAREVASGYKNPLPGIMVREGMQNALDAIKANTSGTGQVTVKIDDASKTITMEDTGKGMTKKEMETVYTDLFESGKAGQAEASGGKGIGKATYMLSGEHFHAESVAIDIDGKRYRHTIDIDPDTVFTDGIEEKREVVPNTTPIGTTFTTKLLPEQEIRDARIFLNDIEKYSRGLPGKLNITHAFATGKEIKWRKIADDTIIGDDDLPNAKIILSYPKGTERPSESRHLYLRILNNGMFQYSESMYVDEETAGLPNDVIVDVRPTVEEGTREYPFPTQRESLKTEVLERIQRLIKQRLVNPIGGRRRAKLAEIYAGMANVRIKGGTGRDTVIFDAGKRLYPAEAKMMKDSPMIQGLLSAYDEALDGILKGVGNQKWIDKLEGVGIVLHEEPSTRLHGIHIPNPVTPQLKSTILINPFSRDVSTPEDTAFEQTVTLLHEAAHIGDEQPTGVPPINPAELNDPRVGKYLQSYLQHSVSASGGDIGHGTNFIKRLGLVYGGYGPKKFFETVNKIHQAISDPANPGRFNTEYTELFTIYKESRGRTATEEDYLAATGIKHATTGGSEGGDVGDATGFGGGTTTAGNTFPLAKRFALKKNTKENRAELLSWGYHATGQSSKEGHGIWEKEDPQVKDWKYYVNEGWNLPRGSLSVDLPVFTSAAFRQGAGAIALDPRAWAKAWHNAARAYGSQNAYEDVIHKLSQDKYFREREDAAGNKINSLAQEYKLAMGDLRSFTGREENIKGGLAEKYPLWGRHVAGSNRAYQAFLNTTRAVAFSRMADHLKNDTYSLSMQNIPGRDIEQDKTLGFKLADMINVLTGRGQLRIETPKLQIGGKGIPPAAIDVSGATGVLTNLFFSPKFQASRIAMLNPSTYINTDPALRISYLKGTIGAMTVWWTIAALAKLLYDETEVSLDPNNSDFGKIKIGNTRFDPGSGMQQYLVFLSRIRPEWMAIPFPVPLPSGDLWEDPGGGKVVSSTTGEERIFGEGYPPGGRKELTQDFAESKLHPSAKYIWDLYGAKPDRPFPLMDKTLQMLAPIFVGDMMETMRDNPMLIPAMMFASSIGWGTSTYEGGKPEPTVTPSIPVPGGTLDEWDINIGAD